MIFKQSMQFIQDSVVFFYRISFLEMTFLMQVIMVGIAGGIACTYFALLDIISIFFNDEEKFDNISPAI